MNAKEIKNAVDAGKEVFWTNENYRVIKDRIGQYLIHSQVNDFYVGLTNRKGDALNGKEEDFFIIREIPKPRHSWRG